MYALHNVSFWLSKHPETRMAVGVTPESSEYFVHGARCMACRPLPLFVQRK